MGSRPPVFRPEQVKLGNAAMAHLRECKVLQCAASLSEMGFKSEALDMAKKCGADLQLAAQCLMEGTRSNSAACASIVAMACNHTACIV